MKHPRTLRLSALALIAIGATAQAETIYGLAANANTESLVTFESAAPGTFLTTVPLSGVLDDHLLQGIDFRPATGQLYAVSANLDEGQIYTVDLTTGALTAVGTSFALVSGLGLPSIDFNPQADALRLIDADGNNLAINPNTGEVTNVGTPVPLERIIVGTAYSNNVAGATSTTLYAYDFSSDTIGTITPPGSGAYTEVGPTTGVVALDADLGFDISGVTGIAYVSLNEGDTPLAAREFFTADLSTGVLTQVGGDDILGFGDSIVIDISAAPAAAVPEPATMAALGLGALALLKRRRKG